MTTEFFELLGIWRPLPLIVLGLFLAGCLLWFCVVYVDWMAARGKRPAARPALSADARRIMDAMPPDFWHSTVPPTLFRIRKLRAEPVPDGYAGAPGDLVFCYRVDDGCLQIEQIYPPKEAAR